MFFWLIALSFSQLNQIITYQISSVNGNRIKVTANLNPCWNYQMCWLFALFWSGKLNKKMNKISHSIKSGKYHRKCLNNAGILSPWSSANILIAIKDACLSLLSSSSVFKITVILCDANWKMVEIWLSTNESGNELESAWLRLPPSPPTRHRA